MSLLGEYRWFFLASYNRRCACYYYYFRAVQNISIELHSVARAIIVPSMSTEPIHFSTSALLDELTLTIFPELHYEEGFRGLVIRYRFSGVSEIRFEL